MGNPDDSKKGKRKGHALAVQALTENSETIQDGAFVTFKHF